MMDKQPCHNDGKSGRRDVNLGQKEAASEKAGKEKMSHMEGRSPPSDKKRKDEKRSC